MKRRAQNHQVTAERGINESGNSDTEDYSLNNVKKDQKKAYRITPTINGVDVTMEIDTGASLLTARQRGTSFSIWSQEVSQLLVWPEFQTDV
jgi:predicted aspartyl protease